MCCGGRGQHGSAHGRHHGHNAECGCGSAHGRHHGRGSDCGCGAITRFGACFATRDEKVAWLEQYLQDLQAEAKAVEERLAVLQGED